MTEAISKSLKIESIMPSESMLGAHFFNSSDFLLNKSFEIVGWQLVNDKPLAQIFFNITNGVAISGFQSTFGSFDVNRDITDEEISCFVKSIIGELRNRDVNKIKIKHFPSYMENSGLIEKSLLSNGLELVLSETNQHICIEREHFEDVANRSEVIRSTKCEQLGYTFKIASLEKLPVIYKLIKSTLSRNGNKPSMTYQNLKDTITACPNNYILFTLWDNEKLISAVVSVKVNDTVMYNFYHADHLEYRNVSSLTYLLKKIYEYCYYNKYKVLDLGISSVNEVLNKGLFDFKKKRGAVTSTKNYYNLSL